ncbi:uncharacterized protein MELLADRAFT_111889 [Melampsora larici-populina 98AG31]|uniref:Uncharacterized protein n=1 Tax=Melampsora larici-populina (strain 98AG31 / pathotype 3-4-7) TaxID=747676 RepID=F4S4P8_MELLP|nr:uncharacterized protein MELLADRAFT_111889 [Melampsora larici-populina 98AG31]EGG00326.1 hypothetical protein MELLADRAFT_111889 [Melampsora larici-populina 98AG31]
MTSNPQTTTSSSSNSKPAFNFTDCSKYLTSRHTATIEGLQNATNGTIPVSERVEVYKPPGSSNLPNIAGSWGSGKPTSMSNGQDFITTLWNKFEHSPLYQSHLSSLSNPNSNHPNPSSNPSQVPATKS